MMKGSKEGKRHLTFSEIAEKARQEKQALSLERKRSVSEDEQKVTKKDNDDCSKENKVKFSSNHGGYINQMFDKSFVFIEPRKMSITRMNKYTELNKIHATDESTEKITPNPKGVDGRKPSIFRRISSIERDVLRKALKTKLRKIAEERLTVRQIFSRYVESSTLHGFLYTCSDTYFIRRLIWAILMVLGALYFIVKLKEGIIEYLDYPFSTLLTVDYVNALVFPAISICPINSLKTNEVYKKHHLKRLVDERRYPFQKNWSNPGFDIPGKELFNMTYESSWKIEEIYKDCDWIKRDTNHPTHDANICGPMNFTDYFHKDGQLCYTVNSGKDNHKLLKVTQPGILHGYEMMFDLRINESLNLKHHAGLYIVIHEQNEPPNMQQGFSVSPGFKTFVAMDVTETRNLPSPYATHCGEKKLKYYDTYNHKACFLERLTDRAAEVCRCREPFMPDNGYPLCSLKQSILCMLPVKESFNDHDSYEDCPINCEETTYAARLSDARYVHNPPKGIEPILMQREASLKGLHESHMMKLAREMNSSRLDQYIQDNIIIVVFYFPEMEKSVSAQDPSFDFYQFLGDMGGEIGLMLGASLLTFVEFIDLFVFLNYHQLLRFHKPNSKGTDDVE